MTWHGWVWVGGGWRWCCQAEGLERCARELSRHARRLGLRDANCGLTTGARPTWTPRGQVGA